MLVVRLTGALERRRFEQALNQAGGDVGLLSDVADISRKRVPRKPSMFEFGIREAGQPLV
jgi:hypothetical protein